MRRKALLTALAGGALVLTGCSAPGPPEVTFYADGRTVNAAPLIHCDAQVRDCEKKADAVARLKARPGKPVQISVPSEVHEAPWLVNVQYANERGELQPVKQEVFTPNSRHAYTATPGGPGDQLIVVEIQQLGAAYAADQAGNPILDEAGEPQLVARAIWSLEVERG